MAKSNNETARVDVILNGQKANATLKEIEASARQLNAELRKLPVNSKEFAAKSEDLKKVKGRLSEIRGEVNATGLSMGKMADGFNKYFALATAGIAAFTGLALSIKNMISAQAELSDSLANIRKTTGMTTEEVEKLNTQLGKINTRTGRQELREMAVVAGQLGIKKDQIFAFVESVDKLNVALGDEMKGGAEEVATSMGTLRNVLLDMKSGNIADDMLRIGNAVNELGADGFATAPVITDFANRIGGIGITLGLTSDEVLGLSATLQELNVSTERGGTAVTKILQKMTTNTKDFAKVAGMPVKEFTNLVNTDLFGAFTKVLEGSKRGGQSATLLAGIIKELEVAGAGASEVFAKLGNNTDMLAEKVALSGKSLQNTDSIMNEFNIKNATLGAALAKLQKDFYNLITLPGVTTFFKNMVGHVIDLVAWFKNLPQFIEKYRISLIAITGITLAWVAAKTKSIQASLLNNILLKEGILLKIKDSIVSATLIAKEELLTIWKAKGTIASKLAATAQWLWNAAISANPIGAIIVGITALVAAIKAYEMYNSRAVALDKLKVDTTVLLASANNKLDKSYSDLSNQMRNISALSAAEKIDLKDKIELKLKEAEAELALFEAKQKSIGKEASKPTFFQGVKTILSGPNNQQEKLNFYADQNRKEAEAPYNEGIDKLKATINQIRTEKSNLVQILNSEQIADSVTAKTLDALNEKLGKYQVALRNTTAGSEDYNRIQNKIKETNKEISKFDSSGNGDPDKKLKTRYEELSKSLKDYIDELQTVVETNPKQAAIIADKIQKAQAEKDKIDELVKSYQHLAYLRTLGDTSSVKGKTGSIDLGRPTTIPDNAPGNVAGPEVTGAGIEKDKTSTETSIWAEKANAFITEYAQPVMDALRSIDDYMRAMEQDQLERDEKVNNDKKQNLKKQLDGKVITQKQYDAAIAKLDLEMDAKKRKLVHDQAVRNKEIALVQAVINTAQAVTAALTIPAAGIALAIVAGALGLIQIGLIAAQPVPQAKRGKYNVIGQDDGQAYSADWGGSAKTGIYAKPTLIAEAGPELVVDAPTTRNIQMNYPGILEAIKFARVPQFASGNYPQSNSIINQPGSNQMIFDPDFTSAIKEFNAIVKSGIRAKVVYSDVEDVQNTVGMISNDVTL